MPADSIVTTAVITLSCYSFQDVLGNLTIQVLGFLAIPFKMALIMLVTCSCSHSLPTFPGLKVRLL